MSINNTVMTLSSHHHHLSQVKQRMKSNTLYLRRSSLMELFTHCPSCHNICTCEVTYVQGTFVAVRQHCSHSEYQRQWTSQPQIKDTPAGNVLLSAAILFSGATPGKVLRMLSHMKVACFTDRTFYYHQK